MRIMDNHDNRTGRKIFAQLPDNFPDELLDERHAYNIHSQTLKRLNERGGLSIMELLMHMKKQGVKWLLDTYGYNCKPTEKEVNELVDLMNNAKTK